MNERMEDASYRYDIGTKAERTRILCDALDDLHALTARVEALEAALNERDDLTERALMALDSERETVEILSTPRSGPVERWRIRRAARRAAGLPTAGGLEVAG